MGRTRDKETKLRSTLAERKIMERYAKEAGMSLNSYILSCALKNRIVVVDDESRRGIKGIGNNLNQLAKRANQGFMPQAQEIRLLREEVQKLWQSLNMQEKAKH